MGLRLPTGLGVDSTLEKERESTPSTSGLGDEESSAALLRRTLLLSLAANWSAWEDIRSRLGTESRLFMGLGEVLPETTLAHSPGVEAM